MGIYRLQFWGKSVRISIGNTEQWQKGLIKRYVRISRFFILQEVKLVAVVR